MHTYTVEIKDAIAPDFAHECLSSFMRYEVWRNEAGLLHRDGGPAVTATDPKSGTVYYRGWYAHGLMHKDDGPAMIYNEGDGLFQYQWMRHGKLHREGAPADIIQETLPTGPVNSIERWYKEGNLHRIGGPAVVIISRSGVITREEWAIDGRQSRGDGPSEIERDEASGQIVEERWMQNGQHHRIGGPAYLLRDVATREIVEQVFCQDGQRMVSDHAPAPRMG